MKRRVAVGCVVIGLLGLSFGTLAQPSEAWIPGVASLILPGLGQFLNDEVGKAFLHLGIAVAIDVGAFYLVTLLPFGYLGYPLVGLAHLGWALYSGYDAYTVAKDRGFTIGIVDGKPGFALAF